MWQAHRLHGRCDRACIHDVDVLANASDRQVRAKRLVVESDGSEAKLGADPLA